MQTIEAIRKKIDNTEDLHSIVRTMKSIAIVNIQHYEKAVRSLVEYNHTVELGLQILTSFPQNEIDLTPFEQAQKTAFVIIGSDQGMVGQFNHKIVNYAIQKINSYQLEHDQVNTLAVGFRASALLEDRGFKINKYLAVPGSINGITPLVQELLLQIEEWREKKNITRIWLIYNAYEKGTSYHPGMIQILPIDFDWLRSLKDRNWLSKGRPTYFSDWDTLFASMIREYFFVSIFRSVSESLASENASRLEAMQAAEKNVEERLGNLRKQFQQTRQIAIMDELLDVISGYEMLKEK